MRIKKLLLLAVGFFVSSTLLAAVDNIKISGDINIDAVVRNLSLGLTGAKHPSLAPGQQVKDKENFIVSQIRLRFDADLTEDVSATVRLLNERVWGAESSANTDLDLDLAYVNLRGFIMPFLNLKVGRQEIRFGNGFIIGDPYTNRSTSSGSVLYQLADDISLRKSFDAIRATLDLEPWTVDLVYAKVYEGATQTDDDINLYGINVNYSPADETTIEGYFFAKDKAPELYSLPASTAYVQDEESKVYCVGSRIKKDLNKKLTLNLEVAHQFGDYRGPLEAYHSHRDAYGAQVGLDYKFLNKAYSILGFWYTYLSGDADDYGKLGGQAGRKFTGWDPMFEDQTGGELINLILPQTNSHTIVVYFFTYLRKNVNMLLKFTDQMLVKNYFSNRYAITEGPAYGNYYYLDAKNKHIGDELDCKITFDYSENSKFILDGAVFFPGGGLASENDNVVYGVTGSVKISF